MPLIQSPVPVASRQASRRSGRGPTSGPRGRRCSTRSPGSSPSSAALLCSTWPRKGFDVRRRRRRGVARGCCRWPSSRACATSWPSACSEARRALSERTRVEEQNRCRIEEMLLEPGDAQVGARLARGHRRAGLPALARAPALGPPRDAAELVAGRRLLRLPVSRAAPAASSGIRRRGSRREHRGLHGRAPVRARGRPRGPDRAAARTRTPTRSSAPTRSCRAPPRPSSAWAWRRLLEERGAVRTRVAAWTPYGGWIPFPADAPRGYGVTRRTLDPMLRDLAAGTPGVELLDGPDRRRPARRRRAPGRRRGRGPQPPDRRRSAPGSWSAPTAAARASRGWRGVPGRVREHNRFAYFAYWRGIRPASDRARVWFLDPDGAAVFPNEDDLTVIAAVPHRSAAGRVPRRSRARLRAAWSPGSPTRPTSTGPSGCRS